MIITTAIGAFACGTLLGLNDDDPSDSDAQARDASGSSSDSAGETGAAAEVIQSDDDVRADAIRTCGTMMTDGFEGSWIADWNEVISPSPTHITIDTSRFHSGASSVRFKTNTFSDVTRLARALTGSCKLRITAWFFVTAASGKDGSGLIEIGRAGNHVARIGLVGNTLRVQDDLDNGLSTAPFNTDTWTPLTIDLDPTTGVLIITLNNQAASQRQVALGSPTFVRIGIMGANDGAQGPDEILVDDVVITH